MVIAIDVGYEPTDEVDYSLFGLMGRTIDAMMRSATRTSLADADMTIAVDVAGFSSLDWRRADELIARGYRRPSGSATSSSAIAHRTQTGGMARRPPAAPPDVASSADVARHGRHGTV